MSTALTIIVAFLAVVFVISGLSKASGNEKGLSGTRDVNVPDKLARLIGFIETALALGLIISMKWNWMLFFPLVRSIRTLRRTSCAQRFQPSFCLH
jgi:uncharacterized membrane protein YphA (DoxX/SURF4 family)